MMQLNGWQRIFTVACAFLAVGEWRAGASLFPTQASDAGFWARSAGATYPDVGAYVDDQFCLQYCVMTPEEVARVGKVPKPPPERVAAYDKIIQTGKHDTAGTLLGRQLSLVAIYLGVWLAMCAGLYAAGWTAAWVIRGFRKPTR